MDRARPERVISLDMTLRAVGTDRIALKITDECGCSAECCINAVCEPANTPQAEARRRTLARLGGTNYILKLLTDNLGDIFVPVSTLTALRRDTLNALDSARRATYKFDRRRPCLLCGADMIGVTTTYHDNVANSLAAEVYTDAGAEVKQKAVEVERPQGPITVMTTRYCLRRELGACLRTDSASKLPSPLFISAPGLRYRLDFDCRACEMKVIALP